MPVTYKYHVAISFAEEDRNAALALALAFELAGVKNVYYYPDQPAATTGKVLCDQLRDIYSKQARFTVVLLSKKYFKKPIVKAEVCAIHDRIKENPGIVTVIPVYLKKKIDIPGYPYLKALTYMVWNYEPKKIAALLKEEFGKEKRLIPPELFVKRIDNKISVNQSNKAKRSKKQQNTSTIKL